MIVIGHQRYVVERSSGFKDLKLRPALHIFVGHEHGIQTLCGVEGLLTEHEMWWRTLEVGLHNMEGDLMMFMKEKDRCAKCARWLEKNLDALVAAERLAATR